MLNSFTSRPILGDLYTPAKQNSSSGPLNALRMIMTNIKDCPTLSTLCAKSDQCVYRWMPKVYLLISLTMTMYFSIFSIGQGKNQIKNFVQD